MIRLPALAVACLASLATPQLWAADPVEKTGGDQRVGNTRLLELGIGTGVDLTGEVSLNLVSGFNYSRIQPGDTIEVSTTGQVDVLIGEDRIGDASFEANLSDRRQLAPDLGLEFDARYLVERDRELTAFGAELVSYDHSLEGGIGLDWQIGAAELSFDAGAASKLHGATMRDDGRSFGRHAQDYVEPEISLRLAFGPAQSWQPFVETAYVARRYLSEYSAAGVRRHMHGPELIAGVQTRRKSVEGQIAAIISKRYYREPHVDAATVIGPYIDITFKPGSRSEISFAAAAQIDQETTGGVAGKPFYSAKFDAACEIRDGLQLNASAGLEYENEPGPGGTLTLTPELKLTWEFSENLAFTLASSLTWEHQTGSRADVDAVIQVGWSYKAP